MKLKKRSKESQELRRQESQFVNHPSAHWRELITACFLHRALLNVFTQANLAHKCHINVTYIRKPSRHKPSESLQMSQDNVKWVKWVKANSTSWLLFGRDPHIHLQSSRLENMLINRPGHAETGIDERFVEDDQEVALPEYRRRTFVNGIHCAKHHWYPCCAVLNVPIFTRLPGNFTGKVMKCGSFDSDMRTTKWLTQVRHVLSGESRHLGYAQICIPSTTGEQSQKGSQWGKQKVQKDQERRNTGGKKRRKKEESQLHSQNHTRREMKRGKKVLR